MLWASAWIICIIYLGGLWEGGWGVVVFKVFCIVCVEVLTICLYQKVVTNYLLNFLKISLHLQFCTRYSILAR